MDIFTLGHQMAVARRHRRLSQRQLAGGVYAVLVAEGLISEGRA